jgi:protein-disulfide isomerase-like protein with CxxC motif
LKSKKEIGRQWRHWSEGRKLLPKIRVAGLPSLTVVDGEDMHWLEEEKSLNKEKRHGHNQKYNVEQR